MLPRPQRRADANGDLNCKKISEVELKSRLLRARAFRHPASIVGRSVDLEAPSGVLGQVPMRALGAG
jgi:hypothetical protein